MRKIIYAFDGWLSRQYRIYPFRDGADCFLRLQLTQASHPVELPAGLLRAGEPVLALHLWNEYIPIIPSGGPDLGWARKVQRLFIASLHAVSEEMQRTRDVLQHGRKFARSSG